MLRTFATSLIAKFGPSQLTSTSSTSTSRTLCTTMNSQAARRDPNTLSNYDRFTTTHTKTDITIDFDKRILAGNVVLSLHAARGNEKEVVLDTSYLDIHDVNVNEKPCKWELQPRSEPFGSPLKISLEQAVDIGKTLTIDVGRPQNYLAVLHQGAY